MKRFAFAAAVAMFAGGCGISEDAFNEKATELVCEWVVDCFEAYDTVDDCIADADPADPDPSCEYQKDKAKECLDGLEELTCDSGLDDFPAACEEVYTCEDTTM